VSRASEDADHMRKDDDLNALRQRDEFKKLLAELQPAPELVPPSREVK
jgi:hypothetical protein